MRLYILQRTPLKALAQLDPEPELGDVVVTLRQGQDPDGSGAESLRDLGFSVVYGETLISVELGRKLDNLGRRFLRSWYMDRGRDVSEIDGVSIGDNQVQYMGKLSNPCHIVRLGEITRKMIELYPSAGVFSDLGDGEGIRSTDSRFLPSSRVVEYVASALKRPFHQLRPINAVPAQLHLNSKDRLAPALRALIGGFRPVWLREKLRWRRAQARKSGKPLIYVFNGRGSNLVADRLVQTGKFRVAIGSNDARQALPLRHDHLFALPSLNNLWRAWMVWRHAKALPDELESSSEFECHGINYGPLLSKPVADMLSATLLPTLLILAQTKKLMRTSDADGYIINGEGNGMSFLAALTRDQNTSVYYLKHGFNVNTRTVRSDHLNESHLTYLSCGSDHSIEFGLFAPGGQKPRTVVVGNQLTSLMQPIQGQRPIHHKRRLLIISFGNLSHYRGSRVPAGDQYIIDVFALAEKLASEGWTISYRPHPGHPLDLEKRIADEVGVTDIIKWDIETTLNQTLLKHDVVLSSNSSVYYQALFAGWPCVFYEPNYLPQEDTSELYTIGPLIGLPVAHDIKRPVTSDPDIMGKYVRETLDPNSFTSAFPEILKQKYGSRFFGTNPDDPVGEAIKVIENDLVNAH